MKLIKYLFIFSLLSVLAVSCEKGLDPIIGVDPKPDATAPQLVINYPVEGKAFVSPDVVATMTIKLVAEDDAELKSVTLELDGAVIAIFTEFLDYRRLDLKYNYPSITEGDHILTVTVEDLTGKTISQSINFSKITAPTYTPLEGEVLYLPLDGFLLDLITGNELSVVGNPGYAPGKVNDCYAGAPDSYLTYPATGLMGSEFGLSLWYKINADPLRAGIMAISPEGDSRNSGFRFLRENNGDNQNIGINFGIGSTEVWMNPFVTVPTDEDWMHIAISISTTLAVIYVNGEVAMETELESGIDWTGCSSLTIASGEPNFVYWEHFSDNSLYDEIHLFTRAITAAEVQSFYAGK